MQGGNECAELGRPWERGEMQKTDADADADANADDAMNPSFAALCTAVFPRSRIMQVPS